MPKLSPIHWKKFEKFVLFVGCKFKREKGDHRIYWRDDLKRPIVFPRDSELPVFVIKNNLRILNIGVKEYLEILGQDL
ncbi:MAG: type II toxin-antitoxin system HicA family toxin [Patescibacteria group bacterium]